MNRLICLAIAILALFQPLVTLAAAPADYPNRPLTIVVPYSPGGVTDTLSRYVAMKLGDRLGQQVVILNQPGGGGTVGANKVIASAPDGYTLLITIESLTISPVLYPERQLNPLEDFTPITLLATAPQLIVASPDFEADNIQELIELAKNKPNQIAYASSGLGTALHLGMEQLQSMAGIKLRHIPYKGGGQQINALLAGDVKVGTIGVAPALQHIRVGKLKALAITKSTRSPLLPDVPTVAEAGLPGFSSLNWFGAFGPKDMPESVVNRLYQELKEIMLDPAAANYFSAYGVDIVVSKNPSDFRDFLNSDMSKWKDIVEKSNMELE